MVARRIIIVGLLTGLALSAGCANMQTSENSETEQSIVVPQVEPAPASTVQEPEPAPRVVYESRVVTEEKGIFIRSTEGKRIKAIAKGTEITNSRKLTSDELPESIANNATLQKYVWAIGDLGDQTILFAWDFTAPGQSD